MIYIYTLLELKQGKKLLLTNQSCNLTNGVCFVCLNSNVKHIHLQKLEVLATISHTKTNWDK